MRSPNISFFRSKDSAPKSVCLSFGPDIYLNKKKKLILIAGLRYLSICLYVLKDRSKVITDTCISN